MSGLIAPVSDTPHRGAGRRQVLAALGDHGPASRVELGRRTGLSSSAVSTLVQALLDDEVLHEVADPTTGARGRGRPAHRLALRPPQGLVVAVDAGNTHVRVAAGEVGGPVLAERAVTQHDADDPDDLLALAETLVREVVGASGHAGPLPQVVRSVVLGVPAPLEDDSGRVADNNILPRWVGRRPGAGLQDRLGVEVAVENDANLGAVGEQRADPAATSLVYLKLGTGIGSGLVLDGRLFHGAGGTAGEVGHVQVDPAGVLCRCGSRGCLETVVSVPRLLAALAPVTRADLAPDDLAHLVEQGHTGAVRVVTDAGRTVGQVLAALVTVINPGLLVVGGPLGPVNTLLASCIRAAVDHWAQPTAAARVEVRASSLGDRAEVLGALALASEREVRRQRVLLGQG